MMLLYLVLATLLCANCSATPATQGTTSRPVNREPCSPLELQCVSKELVPFSDGKCHPLLEQGPCPKGQWIVLQTGDGGQLQGRCTVRHCPPGEVAVAGRCLQEEQARGALCSGDPLYIDAEGNPRCGRTIQWGVLLIRYAFCSPSSSIPSISGSVRLPGSGCIQNDKGECVDSVSGKPSIIGLQREK